MKPTDKQAVHDGVYHACLDMMDAGSNYPITREEIIDAVENGVKAAVFDLIGTDIAIDLFLGAIRDGVKDAQLELQRGAK